MKFSVVPYFREVAVRLGAEREQEWLTRIGYGNADPSSGLTDFWLGGSLEISPDGQVEFLQRFYRNRVFSAETTRLVKDLIVLEETPEYRLSGKTGAGPEGDGWRGWLVGYVERGERVWFYALTVKGPDAESIRTLRLEETRRILRERGVLP
jgi:beta-lactamase class D